MGSNGTCAVVGTVKGILHPDTVGLAPGPECPSTRPCADPDIPARCRILGSTKPQTVTDRPTWRLGLQAAESVRLRMLILTVADERALLKCCIEHDFNCCTHAWHCRHSNKKHKEKKCVVKCLTKSLCAWKQPNRHSNVRSHIQTCAEKLALETAGTVSQPCYRSVF